MDLNFSWNQGANIPFSQYSDDEGSDISLGEITDEEQEDLRATLNKSKNPKVLRN